MRPGLQSRQFSQADGIAQVSETVVPANAQRQAHQDRCLDGQTFPLRDISDGPSGCAENALSGNPCPNPSGAFFDNTCEAGMMCGTAESRVLEWKARVAGYKPGRKKWLFDVFAILRWRFLRVNSMIPPEFC